MKSRTLAASSLLVLLMLLVGWRVVTVNLNRHQALHSPSTRGDDDAQTVESQLNDAVRSLQSNPEQAMNIALSAAEQWPGDGRPLALAGLLLEQRGKTKEARALMKAIDTLHPRAPALQVEIGNFWLRQGDVADALPHWSTAMRIQPALTSTLFPPLLTLAENPQNYEAVKKLLFRPAGWDEGFFQYAVSKASSLDTLKVLYHAPRENDAPPSAAMRKTYLDRLEREKRWSDAFFVWFNGLSDKQLAALTNIFDGDFEVEAAQEGFAWYYSQGNGIRIAPEPVTGGSRSLHVAFLGTHRPPQQLVRQRLLLDPGLYQLTGKIKVDTMAALHGLRWELGCVDKANPPLASTAYFAGKSPWQAYAVEFRIPEGCAAQEIRLTLHPADATQKSVSGSVWLDELRINLKQAGGT